MEVETRFKLSAVDTAAEIRAGKISPSEVLDPTLAHTEKTDPAINAFITVGEARAREEEGARRRCWHPGHRLHLRHVSRLGRKAR